MSDSLTSAWMLSGFAYLPSTMDDMTSDLSLSLGYISLSMVPSPYM